jgi:hypothetical protein
MNIDQFRFCSSVMAQLKAAASCVTMDEDDGVWKLASDVVDPVGTIGDALQNAVHLVEQRQKLVRLADRSEFGWSVVEYYLAEPIVDNDEDEKRIKAANKADATEHKKSRREATGGGYVLYMFYNDV